MFWYSHHIDQSRRTAAAEKIQMMYMRVSDDLQLEQVAIAILE
jgi:hypothetical protein